MFIHKRLPPAPQRLHDIHIVFCLRGEPGDLPPLHDGLPCRIFDTSEDGGPVTHGGYNTAVCPDARGNRVERGGVGVINEGGMACRGEEEAVLCENKRKKGKRKDDGKRIYQHHLRLDQPLSCSHQSPS